MPRDHDGNDHDGHSKKKKVLKGTEEVTEADDYLPGGMTEQSSHLPEERKKKRFRWGEYKPFLLGVL